MDGGVDSGIPGISIFPPSATVATGMSLLFTATSNPPSAITWSVMEGAAGGTIDSNGLYTAPSVAGTYHVLATNADAQTASALITVVQGQLNLIAGGLGGPGNVDDVGANARFHQPQGIVIESSGNLLIADSRNNKIRRVTPSGAVTTFAQAYGAID